MRSVLIPSMMRPKSGTPCDASGTRRLHRHHGHEQCRRPEVFDRNPVATSVSTDIIMPKTHGIEVIKAIRAKGGPTYRCLCLAAGILDRLTTGRKPSLRQPIWPQPRKPVPMRYSRSRSTRQICWRR